MWKYKQNKLFLLNLFLVMVFITAIENLRQSFNQVLELKVWTTTAWSIASYVPVAICFIFDEKATHLPILLFNIYFVFDCMWGGMYI